MLLTYYDGIYDRICLQVILHAKLEWNFRPDVDKYTGYEKILYSSSFVLLLVPCQNMPTMFIYFKSVIFMPECDNIEMAMNMEYNYRLLH